MTVFLITLYSAAILKKKRRALGIALLLIGLYAVLYTILHLEDYALLAGSGLLLVVISALMLATRKIGNDDIGAYDEAYDNVVIDTPSSIAHVKAKAETKTEKEPAAATEKE